MWDLAVDPAEAEYRSDRRTEGSNVPANLTHLSIVRGHFHHHFSRFSSSEHVRVRCKLLTQGLLHPASLFSPPILTRADGLDWSRVSSLHVSDRR